MELKIKKALANASMKKDGFTIVEVSILFVIFLIVAFLVAPMSLDDNMIAKNSSKWRVVQSDFSNIFYLINTQKEDDNFDFKSAFSSAILNEVKNNAKPYKITFMNGTFPNATYRFNDYKYTKGGAIIAVKLYDAPQDDVQGLLMYDVNGEVGPNVWGKDVFGMNVYYDRFEPFCKNDAINVQNLDCSSSGTGLCCSNTKLIGGN